MNKTIKQLDVPPQALRARHLKELARQVSQYQYFDAVTLLASADHIPFYGCALALMLKNFPRPVVLFSRAEQSDEAKAWAEQVNSGVFVLGDDGLDLACRTTWDAHGSLCSPYYPPLGRWDGSRRQLDAALLPPPPHNPFLLCDALNEQIVSLYPDEALAGREDLFQSSGVLIALNGAQDLPWLLGEQLTVLSRLHRRQIPVIVTGIPTPPEERDLRKKLLLSGVVWGGDMTREAAAVKLMWTLARTNSLDGVRLYFSLSFCGEVTQEGPLPL